MPLLIASPFGDPASGQLSSGSKFSALLPMVKSWHFVSISYLPQVPGFLNLTTVNLGMDHNLLRRTAFVYLKMFSSFPGFYKKMPVTTKDVSKHCQMSPWEQNYSWLRATALVHEHIPGYLKFFRNDCTGIHHVFRGIWRMKEIKKERSLYRASFASSENMRCQTVVHFTDAQANT